MNASDDDQRMASQAMGRLVVVWHGRAAPSDRDWGEALALIAAQPLDTLRVMVWTEGGAPTPTQQLRLSKVIGGKMMPVAVVSDHIGVRFVASSLALFARRLRTFRPDELPQAYAHLGLTRDEIRRADSFIKEMSIKEMRG